MTTPIQQQMTQGFQQLSNHIASAQDGGFLNYLFEPAPSIDPGGMVLLRLSSATDTSFWFTLLDNLLVQPVQSNQVYRLIADALPPEMNLQNPMAHPRHVVEMLIVLSLLLVAGFTVAVAACFVACCCWYERCCCCDRQRRQRASKRRSNQLDPVRVNYMRQIDQGRVLSIGSAREELHRMQTNTRAVTPKPDIRGVDQDLPLSIASSDIYVNQYPTLNLRPREPTTSQPIQKRVNPSHHLPNERHTRPSQTVGSKPEGFSPIRNQRSSHPKCSFYTMFTCNILLAMCIVVALVFAFYSTDTLMRLTHMGPASENPVNQELPTLHNAVKRIANDIILYLGSIVDQGKQQTGITISTLQSSLTDQLNHTAQGIIKSLLTSYKVQGVFETVDTLQPKLIAVTDATGVIRLTNVATLQALSRYAGQLSAYQSLLNRGLTDLCSQLKTTQPTMLAECNTQLAIAKTLVFRFDPKKIEVDQSISLHVLMEQFSINITSALSALQDAEEELDRMIDRIVQDLQTQFKLEQVLGAFVNLWQTIQDEFVIPTQSSIRTQIPIASQYTEAISYAISVTSYGALVFYALILCAQCYGLGATLNDTVQRSLLVPHGKLKLNGNEHLRVSAIVRSRPIYSDRIPKVDFMRSKVRLRAISVLLACIGLLCWLTVLIGLVLIPIFVLTNTEVCHTVDTSTGQALFDRATELYLQYEWPNIFNNKTVPQDMLDVLTLQPPAKLISTLLDKCNPAVGGFFTPDGLFNKLGYRDVFDFQSLLQGPQIQDVLKNAENDLVKDILKMDFANFIPNDLDELSGLAKNITAFLDNVDYGSSVSELTEPFLPVTSLPTYLASVRKFLASLDQSVQVDAIETPLGLIEDSIPEYNRVTRMALRLSTEFKILVDNQPLTPGMEMLLTGLDAALKVVSVPAQVEAPIRPAFQASTKTLLLNFDRIMTAEFNRYLEVIVPCGELYRLSRVILTLVCGEQSLINRLGMNTLLVVGCTLLILLNIFLYIRYASRYNAQCIQVEIDRADLSTCVAITFEEWRLAERIRRG